MVPLDWTVRLCTPSTSFSFRFGALCSACRVFLLPGVGRTFFRSLFLLYCSPPIPYQSVPHLPSLQSWRTSRYVILFFFVLVNNRCMMAAWISIILSDSFVNFTIAIICIFVIFSIESTRIALERLRSTFHLVLWFQNYPLLRSWRIRLFLLFFDRNTFFTCFVCSHVYIFSLLCCLRACVWLQHLSIHFTSQLHFTFNLLLIMTCNVF